MQGLFTNPVGLLIMVYNKGKVYPEFPRDVKVLALTLPWKICTIKTPMRNISHFHGLAIIRLGLVGVLLSGLLISTGCGYKSKLKPQDPETRLPTPLSISPGKIASGAISFSPQKEAPPAQIDEALVKEEKTMAALKQANQMMKSSNPNLDEALRVVQKIQQENERDPNITMQTWYMQAMIYHRQKDSPKRKDAMNQMLKSMESLQKDPRFLASFADGKEALDIMQKSIDSSGNRYEK